jgi:hypothetical protein
MGETTETLEAVRARMAGLKARIQQSTADDDDELAAVTEYNALLELEATLTVGPEEGVPV